MKILIISSLFLLLSCGKEAIKKKENEKEIDVQDKNTGIIGATCEANPIYYKHGRDVCFSTGKIFYPGLTMVFAKSAIIKECQRLNALDHSEISGPKSCYGQCSTISYCIYGDNR